VSRYGAIQAFIERAIILAWIAMGGGLLVLVMGAVALSWVGVLAGAGIIVAGFGYRWLAEWFNDRALRRDFEDRWRR